MKKGDTSAVAVVATVSVFLYVTGTARAYLTSMETDEEQPSPPTYFGGGRREIDEENPPPPPKERVSMLFPGTKWCGPGNCAADYRDLGERNETDRCCREHDFCDDLIPAGHSAHGLVNDAFYSKLHCECDEAFGRCLRASSDGIGDVIGKLYFDAIGTQCFRLDFPVVRCVKHRGYLRKRCLEYEFDTSKRQIYQWFDVPPYSIFQE